MTRSPKLGTKLGIFMQYTAKATRNKRQILKLTAYYVTDDFGALVPVTRGQSQVSAATYSLWL